MQVLFNILITLVLFVAILFILIGTTYVGVILFKELKEEIKNEKRKV